MSYSIAHRLVARYRLDHYPYVHETCSKIATTVNTIMSQLDPEIKGKSGEMKVVRGPSKPPYEYTFTVSNPSAGSNYEVIVHLDWEPNTWALAKGHIKLSCSCPYWRWQGPEYHAKQQDYLLGKPRGTASTPNVRDPDRTHLLCKHSAKVLDILIKYARKGKRQKLRWTPK